jgi:hypothetical protein
MTGKTFTIAEAVVAVTARSPEGWAEMTIKEMEAAVKGSTGKRDAVKRAKAVLVPTKRGSVIDPITKAAYGKAANCGDQVAVLLKDAVIDNDSLKKEAIANGIDASRWDHLNFGMQRMNLGNVLRGMANTEKPVTIGGVTVTVQ